MKIMRSPCRQHDLDPLLIYGPGFFPRLGVAGAAWATVIAQALAAMLSLRLLSTGCLRLKMTLPDWRPNANLCWRITKIGLPGAGQMLLRSLMNATMFRIVAPFGTAALAGYSVSTRLNVMILMPAFSFGNASATMVGQNLGAGRPDRAVRAAWTAVGIEAAIMVAASVMLIFFAPFFLKIFVSEAEAIRIGTEYFRVEAPFYIFSAVSIVLSRAMRAWRQPAAFIINAFTLWASKLPLAYTLSARLAQSRLDRMATTQVVHALIVTSWFMLGRWKTQKNLNCKPRRTYFPSSMPFQTSTTTSIMQERNSESFHWLRCFCKLFVPLFQKHPDVRVCLGLRPHPGVRRPTRRNSRCRSSPALRRLFAAATSIPLAFSRSVICMARW